ncbi:hypothetical protein [Halorubrum sp. T3]|uniref:hypothetical protein n=1 Tax=Halorubrum sp. T3 TaxID=1194088 RepID=UPI00035C6381
MSDEFFRTVEHIEEIGVYWDTYLDEFINEIDSKFHAAFVVFLVEPKSKQCCFLIGVECVDEILSSDIAVNVVIVEFPCVWRVLACFVREGVVDDDDTFTGPSRFVGLLEQFESFFVEMIFLPVVLGEELVQGSFTLRQENYVRDSLNALVAGGNKTCHIRLGVVFLPRREILEPANRLST